MRRRALLSVNLAVVLFGLAGLFAKWVALPALGIAFGRVLFSSLVLGAWLLLRGESLRLSRPRDLPRLCAAGVVLALHWWAFLAAIQLSTVAVGTITFSAFPLFVTFLEPLVLHTRLRARDVGIALLILIGVAVTAPSLSFESGMLRGLLVGMISSFAYAVLTVLNKSFAGRCPAALTAFYEQATAALVLLPLVLRANLRPAPRDLALLLFLGVVTTALAHTLFISGLRTLPARLAGVLSSLETVYGILFALLLLGEVPAARECLGAAIILGAVLLAQRRPKPV